VCLHGELRPRQLGDLPNPGHHVSERGLAWTLSAARQALPWQQTLRVSLGAPGPEHRTAGEPSLGSGAARGHGEIHLASPTQSVVPARRAPWRRRHAQDLSEDKDGWERKVHGRCDNPPRKIPYYRLNQSTLVIKQ
jgi:hypothetical protein